jgi:DNA polymerase-3 subunit epsilon
VLQFCAIDFETATRRADSVCAVGLVRVEAGQVTDRCYHLVRPERREFAFTGIHGIRWEDVLGASSFRDVWGRCSESLHDASFVAAHGAAFDSRVLAAACHSAGLPRPRLPFVCTIGIARRVWGIYPTGLSEVCRVLQIPLDHHHALSDAEACASIVIMAQQHKHRRAAWPDDQV